MAKKLNIKGIELPLLKETDTATYPRLTVKRDGITYNAKTAKADNTNKKAGTECFKFGDYEWLIKNSWGKSLPADCSFYVKNNYPSTYQTMTVLPEELDASNATNMNYMFSGCNAITSISQLDTSKVTNMGGMFNGCLAITSIPQLDTSKVTDMGYMFNGCNAITTIPQLDTSKVTNMGSMFNSCRVITSIPQLDTSKVTNMYCMFINCRVITSIPQLDTSKVTDMRYMFNNCTSLPEEFPWTIDCSSIDSVPSSMFDGSSVKKVTFKNVKNSIKSQFTKSNLGAQLTKINIL